MALSFSAFASSIPIVPEPSASGSIIFPLASVSGGVGSGVGTGVGEGVGTGVGLTLGLASG